MNIIIKRCEKFLHLHNTRKGNILSLSSLVYENILTSRFGGTDCGFPVSLEELRPFVSEATHSPCGDRHLQSRFEDLHRQSGLMQPMTWETCVELYITLKNMADL